MIDHVSIAVRDLDRCGRFYEAVLAAIGYGKLVARPATIGFGKKYPDFWLNERRAMIRSTPTAARTSACARRAWRRCRRSTLRRMQGGGTSDGAPGPRPEYTAGYYAAFVRDPEGNKIEAVTFTTGER